MTIALRQIEQIISSSGKPVLNGYIYIGSYGQDPVANPLSLFSDAALTTPIANPQRTDSLGRPVNDAYIAETRYSYELKDAAGVTIEGPKDRFTVARIDAVVLVVNSIADLRALTGIADGQKVSVSSYYGDDNGGSGDFVYRSASVVADNGGTVIKPTAVSGAGRLLAVGLMTFRRWGAKADGTDASAAFAANILAQPNGQVLLEGGSFSCHDVANDNTNVIGDGVMGTTLLANSVTNVMKLKFEGGTDQWRKRKLEKFLIDGNAKASHGIQFDPAVENAGRWWFEDVSFQNCLRAADKPSGNIGNYFEGCSWDGNDYGYYAVSTATNVSGSDTLLSCHLKSSRLAAIYIDSARVGTGGHSLRDLVIENNPGFGLFVYNYSTSYTPLLLDNVYFENNGTGGAIAAADLGNGAAYTPKDIYLRNCARATIINGMMPSVQLVSSRLKIQDSWIGIDHGALVADSASQVIADGCHYDGGVFTLLSKNVLHAGRPLGTQTQMFWVEPRAVKNFDPKATTLQSVDFASQNVFQFSGGAVNVNATVVADGQIFDQCQELVIPIKTGVAGSGVLTMPTAENVTAGRWYVFTVDLKHVAGDLTKLSLFHALAIQTMPEFSTLLTTGSWRTIAGIGQASANGTTVLFLTNTDTVNTQTLRFSAYQFVEFSTEAEALNYLNTGVYQQTTTRNRELQSTVAPTTGTWSVGDVVTNTAPAVGQPKGWRCTVAGTPGTWVSEGNL